MKRFIAIIACAAISASIAFAQNDEYKHVFLQLQGGAAETIGESAWTNLISPSAAVSLGYQFSPVFAARLNVNGWQGKGAIYNNLYKYNFVEGGVELRVVEGELGLFRRVPAFNQFVLHGAVILPPGVVPHQYLVHGME